LFNKYVVMEKNFYEHCKKFYNLYDNNVN